MQNKITVCILMMIILLLSFHVNAGQTNQRFLDNNNGTVTDNLTGLIWLKDAYCLKTQEWETAITSTSDLKSGKCGLTDGSTAGQWHLPSSEELQTLIDSTHSDPSLPTGHPFVNVWNNWYWSSSSYIENSAAAWVVSMAIGKVAADDKNYKYGVWPVRSR